MDTPLCNNILVSDNLNNEDNELSSIGYSINLQLLHSNVEKLDLIEKLSKDKLRVYQKGKKLDTYFSCTGKYPPKTAPYSFDTGIDLYLQSEVVLEPNVMIKINTQTKILINTTTCGIIYPKSRIMGKLSIFRGVIDPNYTGDIIIGVTNITKETITLSEGSSICQLVITECNLANLIECKHIEYMSGENNRGDKGFGSSGNNISASDTENINNLSFIDCIEDLMPKNIIFEKTKIYNILEETAGDYNIIDQDLDENGQNQVLKRKGLNYIRGKYLTLNETERQDMIKEYLNRQTLKNATLYTDAMKDKNFDNEAIKNLQIQDEYLGGIYNECKIKPKDPFIIINKMLYKNSKGHYRLCIPSILLISIIKCIHDKLLHCSKRQCISNFKKYFYHPFAMLYVTKYSNITI